MAVIAGITVFELRESFSEGIAEGGPHATKAWYVPNWSDRYTVANSFLGLATLVGGPSGTISFTHPISFPESPNLWAQSVIVRGVGKCHQGPVQIAWDSAIVTVNYGIPSYNYNSSGDIGGYNSFDPNNPYVYASQDLDFGAMVVDVPGGVLKLNDGAATPNYYTSTYGITIPVVHMNLTLHNLPYLVPASVRAKAGNINLNTFWECAPGTLQFHGVKPRRQYFNNGTVSQETTMAFSYRPAAPWDQVLHPKDPTKGWVQLLYNNASPLTSSDFNDLIPSAYRA